MELEGRAAELKRQGLGVIAISYDPPAVLKQFSQSRGITFPLISDAGSAIIRRFGLLNTTIEEGTRTYGIPFPGTFLVDRRGMVRSRHFEDAYQERNTVASLLVRQGLTPFGPVVTAATPHLTVTGGISDSEVAPGQRVSIALDVTPRPGMHVYAPGKHSYQVVRLRLDPQLWARSHATVYPPSERYHFVPLDERVEVYQKPFRLVHDVTILATQEVQKLLAGQTSLSIRATLDYQACDDKLCYAPQSIPLSWDLGLKQLDRKPSG